MIKDLIRSTGDSWKGIGKNREKEKKDWKELMKKRRKKQNLKKKE